jgi:hypothetical protein
MGSKRPLCPKCRGHLQRRKEWNCHLIVIACANCGWRTYPPGQRDGFDDFITLVSVIFETTGYLDVSSGTNCHVLHI